MDLEQTRIVLVGTTHPGNIGAAARAMKNMGLSRLVLAAPGCALDRGALHQAANAGDVVENARIVDSVSTAVADCTLVLGTSARMRRLPWPVVSSNELGSWLNMERQGMENRDAEGGGESGRLAILFGRESSGLTNEELQLCHAHIEIPSCAEYRALNLAMAVQIVAYELRLALMTGHRTSPPVPTGLAMAPSWDAPPASHEDVEHLLRHVDETMLESGFYDPRNPRQLPNRVRRLFQRVRLDRLEVGFIRGWLKAMQRCMAATADGRTPEQPASGNHME